MPLLIAVDRALLLIRCRWRRFSIVAAFGEAEAILPEMLPVLKAGASENRAELKQKLMKLPGVYVRVFATAGGAAMVKDLDKFRCIPQC